MAKSKVMRIISIVLIAIFAFMMLSQVTFAAPASNTETGKSIADTDTTIFTRTDQSGASDAVTNIIGSIINIAQIIGMGVAIIMLIVLAIQYIAAAPEGKAEIKKNATIYIVGAIILFAAAAILQIIKNFAIQNVGSTENTAF